ncbi:MAG: hypothetical protein IJA97_06890 [Clostridia bacterium]|nr:hypothetical protein [Clostridia bacterium]
MKKFLTVFLAVLTLAVVISAPFLLRKKSEGGGEKTVVLTLWHTDAFEGGKGSRCAFLRNVASMYSKEHKGVYVLVSNYSPSGLKTALEGGKSADIISFGGCDLGVENYAKEIDFKVLDGGTVGKKRYAVSYLKGSYFEIVKGSGDKEIILSKGEYTSPQTACLFSNAKSDKYVMLPPADAYNRFLIASNATLIGTQRDIVRLKNINAEFSATPITTYNDLYQYLSLTTSDESKVGYALDFIRYLLSSKVQDRLSNLSMFSVNGARLYDGDEHFSLVENAKNEYTFIPFSTKDNYDLLGNTAFSELEKGTNYDVIVNSCKNLINVVK